MVLISMDPASSETTCELADDALEELLEHPHVSDFIENRLFSKRLPEDALWRGKQTIDGSRPNVKLELLKRSVLDAQEAIGRVRAAWDTLPEDLFAEAENRADFESVLEETGAFRVLVVAVGETGNRHREGEVQLRLLSDPRFQTLANSRKILAEWTNAIPSPSRGCEARASKVQAASRRVVDVLLISPFDEDHQDLRDILKHSNWQQYDARTQGEAIEFLRKNPIPVVICESELPDGAWQDVLSQLGRMQCPPLLVVTSRKTDDRLWSEALNLGAYNVLAKPLNVKEVFHVVGLAWLSWKRRWERPQEHLRSA